MGVEEIAVLVTGGAGFIGSHLVDKLVELGLEVKVLDNLTSGRLDNIKKHIEERSVEFVRGDLKNTEITKESVKDVNVVFHFAANPEVRVSTTNPGVHFNENVVATFNLLEAARLGNVETIVFASSSSVYGEPAEIPVNEDAPIKPVSVYGASKAACENLLHAYSKLYGLNVVVLRYANVVGPRLRHGVIYDLLVKLFRDKEILEVLGDGTQTRSYLYVNDAVEATVLAWLKSSKGFSVYNVGNIDWVSVRDVVEVLLMRLSLKGVTRVVYKPVLHGVGWPGDVKKIALDVSKLLVLGWKPTMSSKEAVYSTIESLLKELKHIYRE